MTIYLLGNKNDLVDLREVEMKAGKALADRLGVNGFYEVSAKTGENVGTAFNTLAETAFLALLSQQVHDDRSSVDANNVVRSISLNNTQTAKQGCCK